jgi:hypothetical protein
MNRTIALAAGIVLAPLAWGQLYKYVDKEGKTVYTDQPPASADSKTLKAPPPPTVPTTQAAPERKEPAKARNEARPAPTKVEKAPLTAAEKEERCQAARANYAIFLDAGPVTMRNTATGERFQLDENQAAAEKAKAKAAMDEACKTDR